MSPRIQSQSTRATSELRVFCPHCHTIIRVPADRLADQPKCAKCHQALFTGQPFELTAEYFDRHVERSDIPLLVDFWAAWCGPCQAMAPDYAQAARTLEPRVHMTKVDTENQASLAARLASAAFRRWRCFLAGARLHANPVP